MDFILALCLELPLQRLGEGEHHFLLGDAGRAAGAWVDAAVTWIEDDHGLGFRRCGVGLGRQDRAHSGRRRVGVLQLGSERGAVGGDEVDHEPCGLIRPRLKHESLVHQERAAHVDDDAGFAGGKQTEAVARDQTPLFVAEARRHLKTHLRQIDNDPVRVGERKDVDADLLR